MPVWITLPSLPLECWNEQALSKIVSVVGVPLATDKLTKEMGRLSYARILVEVDASKDLVRSVHITLPDGEAWEQQICYESEPKFCTHCKMIGHKNDKCTSLHPQLLQSINPVDKQKQQQSKPAGQVRRRRGGRRTQPAEAKNLDTINTMPTDLGKEKQETAAMEAPAAVDGNQHPSTDLDKKVEPHIEHSDTSYESESDSNSSDSEPNSSSDSEEIDSEENSMSTEYLLPTEPVPTTGLGKLKDLQKGEPLRPIPTETHPTLQKGEAKANKDKTKDKGKHPSSSRK